MSQRFDKLVTLLRELFQLDQPELNFGFYTGPQDPQRRYFKAEGGLA